MLYASLDIETLDVKSSAVILSIGAIKWSDEVPLDPTTNTFHHACAWDDQFKLGRTISGSTLRWWWEQDAVIQRQLLAMEAKPLKGVLTYLTMFLQGVDEVWVRGPHFDVAIIDHACTQLDACPPWKYGAIRDQRTLMNCLPQATYDWIVDCKLAQNSRSHDALADAVYQAQTIIFAKHAIEGAFFPTGKASQKEGDILLSEGSGLSG